MEKGSLLTLLVVYSTMFLPNLESIINKWNSESLKALITVITPKNNNT